MRILSLLAAGLLTIAASGCDAEAPPATSVARSESGANFGYSPPMAPGGAMSRAKMEMAAGGAETDVSKAKESATAGRKIIYNARVDLVTEDLNAAESKLLALVESKKAYVADSDRSGSAGSVRRGSWKVRVPVEAYDSFLRGAQALGELVSVHADSQDVSEEFFDLEARETAKKVEETRLLKHLTDSTGKLDEILAVERELTRVRSEIERMQGRLRALGNLTTLATVTITVNEIKGYIPPQAPTFGTKLSRVFWDSVEKLQGAGEAALLFLAAILPWLPIIAVCVGILFLVYRRVSR